MQARLRSRDYRSTRHINHMCDGFMYSKAQYKGLIISERHPFKCAQLAFLKAQIRCIDTESVVVFLQYLQPAI